MAPPGAAALEAGAVQLLLRNVDSRTTVIRARREDTVGSVLDRLGNGAADSGGELRLRAVHAGRELPRGATVGELGLPWDATLHVSYRLVPAPHADARRLASEIAAAARLAAATVGQAYVAVSLELLVRRFLYSARAAHQGKSNSALGPVAEHLGIFLRSGVPGVLVQLYQSDDERRRAEAERAIRCFLSPDPPEGKSIVKALTAPVLLEFCASFDAGASKGDPLYAALRAMAATVLSDPEWTPGLWGDVPRRRVAEHLIRLARETAIAVVVEIAGAYRSQSQPAAARRNLVEFKTFWFALRPQVLELDADTQLRPWRKVLSQALEALLKSVKDCMTRFEMNLPPAAAAGRKHNSSSSALPKWTASLHSVWAVLAELDAWSDVHHAMRTTLAAHPRAVTALVLSAGSELSETIRWITRHRDLLEFEARRQLAMAMLPELVRGANAPPPHEMLIDRGRLLPDSFGYIAHATPQELRAVLSVAFKHEQATGPGVLREWFCLVCQALFNPRLVLFSACPQDRRRFFINPTSVVDPLHLEYFEFAGRMIALALRHKIYAGVFFDRTLFLQLAGRPITLDDIADTDPSLHASCKKILEMDASLVDSNILELTFVREDEVLGSRTVSELFPGGKDIAVTRFRIMFNKWKPWTQFFASLDIEDFDRMLGGSKGTIDVNEWRAQTDYRGYKEKCRQIKWFWKAVENMTVEQQGRLLFFWTSVKCLPSDGFSGLGCRLFIYRASSSRDHLPTSQTCFYHLNLPAYTSLSMMQRRLHMIVQEHVSSGFGAS
ncbi:E3 ubiquitin-protein ligase UPL5-like isoform X2 [Panicum virgatum]|uniref:E3 ubiquitin-protein ligase UPL5-like isoform X2 n=1 Tax=Panicum virgatum TaxID=38727 RepID=UPI0019D55C47|nr:E3 ubiquitin-protein ligase UPL5-like isoform X2 [Panicum virgatum]